jgi:hypothetical protein
MLNQQRICPGKAMIRKPPVARVTEPAIGHLRTKGDNSLRRQVLIIWGTCGADPEVCRELGCNYCARVGVAAPPS